MSEHWSESNWRDESSIMAELTRLRAENEELRKALEPLAQLAVAFEMPVMSDGTKPRDLAFVIARWPWAILSASELRVMHCRRAAELLKPKP